MSKKCDYCTVFDYHQIPAEASAFVFENRIKKLDKNGWEPVCCAVGTCYAGVFFVFRRYANKLN
ncbi:hypothetical protein M0R19_05540 [Candidatus Pacearchaeota archaeon]|nr:hypothetical protein [Candidatus Pacearchaeota archaeon]